MSIPAISPHGLAELCKTCKTIEIIDVRTPMEFFEVHLEVARNVPLDSLDPAVVMKARAGVEEEPLYVICRSGSAATWRLASCSKPGLQQQMLPAGTRRTNCSIRVPTPTEFPAL